MKAKNIILALAGLAVAAALIVFILPKKEADIVRIGVFLPMTGGVASYGQMGWAGIKTANELEPTVLGKKVELILVDEKSDKIEAANAVSRLIKKEKVVALIGTSTSGNTMAGAAIAEEARVPVVSPTATDPRVTQNRKYIFRVCFIDPFQGRVAAKYAYENLKARKAALLVDQAQDYCVDLANFFKQEFTSLGGVIVASTFCQSGDQDFTAQLSSIASAKPDVIYLPNYYTEDALVCKQMAELGLKVPTLSADGAHAPELISIGGNAVEGFTFTGHFAKDGATTELAKKYIQAYEARYKTEAGGFDALGADAYFVLIDAIRRAKSLEGPKIRDALASTKDFPGVSGVMSIGEDGNARKGIVLLQVKNGRFSYLTTINP